MSNTDSAREEQGGGVWQPIGAFGPGLGGSMPRNQSQVVIIEANGSGDLRQRVKKLETIPAVGKDD